MLPRWIEKLKHRKTKCALQNGSGKDVDVNTVNPASQWRFDIAKRVALIYTQNRDIAAVMVGGSTARGHADHYSDTEIGVFWHQTPTEAERARVVEESGADLIQLYPFFEDEQVWCDDFMIERAVPNQPNSGLLVEVAHHTVDFMEVTLKAVLQQYNPDELKQNLIAGVLDGVPIPAVGPTSGSKLLTEWKKRVSRYPRELSLAVVRRHAQIDHFWRWQTWLARGDNRMLLYQSFFEVQQKLLHILLALNRRFYFGFKWLDFVIDQMDIKPKDFIQRLKHVYHVNPAKGAHILTALVEETYDLVEAHLPEVDVKWLRQVFRYQRPELDQPPTLNTKK